ncbi:type IV toxin-antitoxin system AbiEi family antitoxin domain-containing protein, partial [Novosphingobium pentaromativorans]|uniref:type IV toxin-antitoxin system AbiEi family antitoxin domain-containing protein n=1 Tax=Novosphingobium pentaromativorans TaxID=205844 RepID=UPI0005872E47
MSDGNLAGRVFDERQLGEAVGGGSARRYALVNRALKDGSLIRLKRGTYLLGSRYRSDAIHPFAVAQAFLPGSYVSFETALAHHGWIPEAVYSTASVTPRRKSLEFDTPHMGRFTFHPLAIQDYQYLVGVEREKFGALTAFVASPLRALLDLVALRKQGWTGLDWLTSGLRIDEDRLLSLKRKELAKLTPVYKHK